MTGEEPRRFPLLVYLACPSRLAERTSELLEFVAAYGHAPLSPFYAFPHAYFEGGAPGRERTLEWCCKLIDICDEVWLFGISDGTLLEVRHLAEGGRLGDLRNYCDLFDDQASTRVGDLLAIMGDDGKRVPD